MNTTATATNPERRARDARGRALLFVAAGFIAFIGLAWATDAIRPRGVTTIYTVDCRLGAWEGKHCYGLLVPGPRYRFETVAARGEVHFSNNEEAGAGGTYSRCVIEDRANWSCEPDPRNPAAIARKMENGRPVPDPATQTIPFHEIQKWRWLLLRMGFPVGHDES